MNTKKSMRLLYAALGAALMLAGCNLFGKNTDDTPSAPALTGTVSITGSAQVEQTLTADISLLEGTGTVSYRWVRGETDISGATQKTYTLTDEDEGKTIKVRVSRAGYEGNISSAPTAAVTASVPTLTGTMSIIGRAQVGQKLTAVAASLDGTGKVSYQWVRGETDIPDATEATYTLTDDDEGSTIKVRVSRDGYEGSIESAPTAAVTASVPKLTGTVSISGEAQVGQTLTADISLLEGTGEVSYQWVRGETDIPGATQGTYTLTNRDEGKTIKVWAWREGYEGSIESEPTAEVTASTSTLTGTVSITGNAQVGQILTAVASLDGTGKVSYQWVRDETDIPGATQETYTLTEADAGSTIKVRVSRDGYEGSRSSEPTVAVTQGQ